MKNQKKSPLKASPLRQPGQSVQDEINALIDDKMMTWYVLALTFSLIAGIEWYQAIMKLPPQPEIYTIFAIALIAISAYKIVSGRNKLKTLKQARDGEKAIGEFLETLRAKGHHVFHDIIGEGFNLDHVVIGPKGIFTVETKTISKPTKGEAKVTYDGVMLRVDGYKPDRDPIVQAKAQANWLKELFLEELGKRVQIQPIVVYPGWFVEAKKGVKQDVWVINPKGLPTYIENINERLEDTYVHLLKSTLSRRIRQSN